MIDLTREDAAYTAFYCEENIWHLAAHPRLTDRRREVVFMSNATKSCAFWAQGLSEDPAQPVVWDYHVVLWVEGKAGEPGSWILDFDTRSGFPVPARHYLEETFPLGDDLPELYRPRFRLVDADEMRRDFRSDRRHMRDGDGWLKPPPPWLPISDCESNLEAFVDMEEPGIGRLVDLEEIRRKWCRSE